MTVAPRPTVAIVIPCYGQGEFLAGAIESALDQSTGPDEVIVVDDGGEEDLAGIVSRYPAVRLLRQENKGLAAARNRGLREAKADKLIFLDADDRLLPNAVSAGLDCFAAHPEAAFVYGAHQEVRGETRKLCIGRAATRADLVRFNCIGMIASAMFDRHALASEGGFDESLGMCEDWDAFLRLSRTCSFAAHDQLVASYFKHSGNMSNNARRLRSWIETVRNRERKRGLTEDELRAWREGAALWDASYPQSTPAQLTRRAVRKIGRTVRRLRRPASAG